MACFPGVWRKLFFILFSHAAFFVLHLQVMAFIPLDLSLNAVFCPQLLRNPWPRTQICLSHFACPVSGGQAAASDWMTQQVHLTTSLLNPDSGQTQTSAE